MIKKVFPGFFTTLLFIFIFNSSLNAEELWLTAGAGAGLMPGAFSEVSFINIDGSTGISMQNIFGTPFRSDLELTYAFYIPAEGSENVLSGIHGLQFVFLPAWQFAIGESFLLSPRIGIGEQLLFASSSSGAPTRFGYQMLLQGGLNADYLISSKWTAGIEAGYRMLLEEKGIHHGVVFKLLFGHKLLDIEKKADNQSNQQQATEETITADKLIPLKGLKNVLFYETDQSVTIVLLNSFSANESELTSEAKRHLAVAGEYIDQLDGSNIAFHGYVADVQDGDAKTDKELSSARAEAVKTWLIEKGHLSTYSDAETEGLGASNPIGDNSEAEGRALNRRVEIVITLNNQE